MRGQMTTVWLLVCVWVARAQTGDQWFVATTKNRVDLPSDATFAMRTASFIIPSFLQVNNAPTDAVAVNVRTGPHNLLEECGSSFVADYRLTVYSLFFPAPVSSIGVDLPVDADLRRVATGLDWFACGSGTFRKLASNYSVIARPGARPLDAQMLPGTLSEILAASIVSIPAAGVYVMAAPNCDGFSDCFACLSTTEGGPFCTGTYFGHFADLALAWAAAAFLVVSMFLFTSLMVSADAKACCGRDRWQWSTYCDALAYACVLARTLHFHVWMDREGQARDLDAISLAALCLASALLRMFVVQNALGPLTRAWLVAECIAFYVGSILFIRQLDTATSTKTLPLLGLVVGLSLQLVAYIMDYGCKGTSDGKRKTICTGSFYALGVLAPLSYVLTAHMSIESSRPIFVLPATSISLSGASSLKEWMSQSALVSSLTPFARNR